MCASFGRLVLYPRSLIKVSRSPNGLLRSGVCLRRKAPSPKTAAVLWADCLLLVNSALETWSPCCAEVRRDRPILMMVPGLAKQLQSGTISCPPEESLKWAVSEKVWSLYY